MAKQRKRQRAKAAARPAPAPAAARRTALDENTIAAGLFGLLAFFEVFYYPEARKWMVFAAASAVALLLCAWRVIRSREWSVDLLDLLLAAMIAAGALSLAWSANVNGGVQAVIIGLAVLALAGYLKHNATPAVLTAICVGVAVGDLGALLTNSWLPSEQWSGYGNRGYATETMTLGIPFMWPLLRDRRFDLRVLGGIVVLADLVYVSVFTPSVIWAFVLVVFAALFSIVLAFRRRRALGWIMVAAWVVLPLVVGWLGWGVLRLHDRLLIRTELWLNTALMLVDQPLRVLYGHGAGSFIEVFPLFKEAHGGLMPFVNTAFESYVTEAEAAHNEPLQLLVETGLLGFVPFVIFVVTALRAAARRLTDPFIAASGAALVTVLAESLIEYPFQRCATLFLATLALGFAANGASGLRRWRIPVPQLAGYGAAPVVLVLAVGLIFASYRQEETERRLDVTRLPSVDRVTAFNLAFEAQQLDPLERHARVALPVVLDNALISKGWNTVPRATIDQMAQLADEGGHFNTAALVARAQYLLKISNGNDPAFLPLLADLKRGSARVAAVYAIEASYQALHGQFADALATTLEGEKYADGVSAVPTADEAIKKNLQELEKSLRLALGQK